jgi:pyruvate dehydrogenase E2 component (dihydrolipoamide acetyltransferase)
MSITITMPALSPTMEEGNLAKWLVKEGDTVSAGDVIAEIETDKATMEVEAVDEGTVAKILVEAGTEAVKVNAVIAVLAEEGEDVADVDTSGASAPAEAPKADTAATPEPVATEAGGNDEPQPAAGSASSGDRVFATPLARRIAEQKGLDLSAVSGSGPHGRIVKADVEGAQAGSSAKAPAGTPEATKAAAAPAPGMSDAATLSLFEEGSFTSKPHDGMRKIIAARLTESTQTVPSYNISMDCLLDELLALRAQINAAAPELDGKPSYKLSVNDFIVKAMAMALQAVPDANASWTSTARIYHKHSDVGVAVSVDDGLFTPIVRKAEMKPLSVISAEVKDMAGRAKSKKLMPDEYQGGVTAVSNLGMFGVTSFTSIINPPHASIVSIGAGTPQPVVKDGALAVGTVMSATFAFDHRVIDGALGAELASAFKGFIEHPMRMLA